MSKLVIGPVKQERNPLSRMKTNEESTMSQVLTNRQTEYLEFIRNYIEGNECAPRLEEIAQHFYVTNPTASRTLKTLEEKGHLYFNRDKVTGFYIRTPEFFTSDGELKEVPVLGLVDRYGEVHKFQEYHQHFPFMLPDNSQEMFALTIFQHIQSANILARDRMIFTVGGETEPGDICIYLMGERLFLVRMYEMVFSDDAPFIDMAIQWKDKYKEYPDHLFWWPLAISDENDNYFADVVREQQVHWEPVDRKTIIGKAIRLVRRLAI